MEIYVDIDNTICWSQNSDYPNATPIQENIEKVNRLFAEGHRIVYWTARGKRSGTDWSELTKKQLKEWGCQYHDVKFTKPAYDLFIDDKVLNARDWEAGKWIE